MPPCHRKGSRVKIKGNKCRRTVNKLVPLCPDICYMAMFKVRHNIVRCPVWHRPLLSSLYRSQPAPVPCVTIQEKIIKNRLVPANCWNCMASVLFVTIALCWISPYKLCLRQYKHTIREAMWVYWDQICSHFTS